MSATNTNPVGNPIVNNLTNDPNTNPAGNPVIADLINGTTLPSSVGVQHIQHSEEEGELVTDELAH